jgi:hypothetical protein
MREICTSGSVGGGGGNILAYPALAGEARVTHRFCIDCLKRFGGLRAFGANPPYKPHRSRLTSISSRRGASAEPYSLAFSYQLRAVAMSGATP